MMSDEAIITMSQHLSVAELDGETVVLDVETGRYFGLNELGAVVFTLLKEPRSVREIKEAIEREYDVTSANLHRDLMQFLADLQKNQLIQAG